MSKTKKTKFKEQEWIWEYQVHVSFDPRDGIYVARVPELENCHSHGKKPEEALKHAYEAISLWLETAKSERILIPEPVSRKKFSGKFVLRTGKELHSLLAKEASRKGKSMNDFVVEILNLGLKKAG